MNKKKKGFVIPEEKGVKKEKLNWFLRAITLGDRFSYQDFFDRLKKGVVDFLIVFFGVLVSFGVEQKGEDFDDRGRNIDNLINLRDEMISMKEYTQFYIQQNQWVTNIYRRLYAQWEVDNDSVFLLYDEEVTEDEGYYSPLTMYPNLDPFNPPRVVYEAIKLDGTFRFLGPEIGRIVNETYDGTDLKYLMINTDREERIFVNQFNDRLSHKWVYDIEDDIDLYDNNWWVKNRKYIQKDRFLRYNLYNRIELWEQIATQLTDYDNFLDINIKTIDSLVKIKESEITIVYWCLFNCGEEFN